MSGALRLNRVAAICMRAPVRDSSLEFPNDRAELLAIYRFDVARLSECPRLLGKYAGGHHVSLIGCRDRKAVPAGLGVARECSIVSTLLHASGTHSRVIIFGSDY